MWFSFVLVQFVLDVCKVSKVVQNVVPGVQVGVGPAVLVGVVQDVPVDKGAPLQDVKVAAAQDGNVSGVVSPEPFL